MRAAASRIVVAAAVASALAAAPQQQAGVLSRGLTGGVTAYTTVKGDTLGGIGARFGIDAATLAADNALKANATLATGRVLRVDNRHLVPASAGPGVLVINVPQRILFYEIDGTIAALPVAVGQADWRTPLRPFTVVRKETNPTWEVPASIREEARQTGRSLPAVVPPGPNNPLGRFWLGLSIPGVGIHGTNAPASIYRATTHGCIRVGPDDIAWLFPRVELGARGEIIYEPVLLGAIGGDVVLEVHRDVYGLAGGDVHERLRETARLAGLENSIDWQQAAAVLAARHGVARAVGVRKKPPARVTSP